jgi:plastocyanin
VNAGTPGKVYVPGLYFAPNTITVKAGEQVTLNFTNCSTFAHNFTSPALGTPKTDIPAGADVNVTFTAPSKAGKYMYWCSVQPPSSLSHGERGETGEIIVQ